MGYIRLWVGGQICQIKPVNYVNLEFSRASKMKVATHYFTKQEVENVWIYLENLFIQIGINLDLYLINLEFISA